MKVIDSRTACSGGEASVGGDLRHSRELLSKAPESAAEAGVGAHRLGSQVGEEEGVRWVCSGMGGIREMEV